MNGRTRWKANQISGCVHTVVTRLRAALKEIFVPDAVSPIGNVLNAGIFLQPLFRQILVPNVGRKRVLKMSRVIYRNVVGRVLRTLIAVCDIGFVPEVARFRMGTVYSLPGNPDEGFFM
jgi:hypothetical protein